MYLNSEDSKLKSLAADPYGIEVKDISRYV